MRIREWEDTKGSITSELRRIGLRIRLREREREREREKEREGERGRERERDVSVYGFECEMSGKKQRH